MAWNNSKVVTTYTDKLRVDLVIASTQADTSRYIHAYLCSKSVNVLEANLIGLSTQSLIL